MANATFHNFSDEPFTGYWNGKPKTFKAGERVYMPGYLAEHFAKHLTNRELIKQGKETYTSPKFPIQVPLFMELFNKAFIPDAPKKGESEIDSEIARANAERGVPSMNIEVKKPEPVEQGPAAAQAAMANAKAPEELEIPETGDADQFDANAAPQFGPGKASTVIGSAEGDDEESSFEGAQA